jgi:serpin B
MKKIAAAAALLALLLRPALAPAQPPLAQAESAFAIDLYGQLGQQPGNLFFSPYSVSTALGMVFEGAKGATASEIAQVLHLDLLGKNPAADTALLQAVEQQPLLADAQASGFELHAANAIWGAQNYPFNQAFIANIKTGFGGNLEPVDFSDSAAATGRINNWVADQTQGKIQNLISPGVLTADTRLVLTNAIYFRAHWAEPFDKSGTRQQTFHVAPGKDVTISMMHMTDHFDLATADGVKILTIPYEYNAASMVIILPDSQNGLAAIESGLTPEKLNNWLSASQSTLVQLALPKFTARSTFGLNAVLQKLGMKQAFDRSNADFSGIANLPGRRLFISDVIHQAYIGVDEEQTEAAAATAIIMDEATASEPDLNKPVPFIADHPFIYLIRANQSGAILFMGRETDPSQGG